MILREKFGYNSRREVFMTVIIFAILAAGIFLLELLIKNYIETHLEV